MTYRVTTDAETHDTENKRRVWVGEAPSEKDAEWEAKMAHVLRFLRKGRERSVWVVSVEEVA